MSASNQQTLAISGAIERHQMLEKRELYSMEKNTNEQILKPLSKMTEGNKKQYIADVKVMNYLLQAIPNDINNSVNMCKNAKDMLEQMKRLMYGSDVISHVRHSGLMDEFDKFTAKEGESLESVYERFITLVNIMIRNNVRLIPVLINTNFLNCLQPEWSKYVTMFRHNQTGDVVSYDHLYDSLLQSEPHVQALKAKKAAKNHDPLALLAYLNAFLSQSHSNSSYLPQPYCLIHPLSVVNYEDENEGRQNRVQAFNAGNKNDETMNDEVVINLKDKENDFMLDNSYGDETLEELTAAVIMMARIRLADDNAESKPSYDAKVVSEKAIAAQPKMYHGEVIHSTNLIIDSPETEETLKNAKESRLKMRNKMVQLDYGKLNALYEKFVPQQESSVEQTYFSILSTSNDYYETKEVTPGLQILKIPKESKLLKMFEKIGLEINDLQKRIDVTLLEDRQRRWMSDIQNSLREFYKTNVILISKSLSKNLKDLQQELIDEGKKILFTTSVPVKSKNLRATSVVTKSRLNVAKTPTVTNKTPKSKTAQSQSSVTKRRNNVRSKSNTLVTTQKWVAKMFTLPSALVSCDADDSACHLDC
uniref:Integrase, catalytic region, zinc finger, CCHC-type, peptidase aspartic, catalytic n=1 Tax=Tanacetum cinerariifolium TaxID=118510 RepID=A0A6L2K5E6_TANCI|nr:hypothetical protein [Tanacetum cinerariifolium]